MWTALFLPRTEVSPGTTYPPALTHFSLQEAKIQAPQLPLLGVVSLSAPQFWWRPQTLLSCRQEKSQVWQLCPQKFAAKWAAGSHDQPCAHLSQQLTKGSSGTVHPPSSWSLAQTLGGLVVAVGGLIPAVSSRQQAPASWQLAVSLLQPFPEVLFLLFWPWGHNPLLMLPWTSYTRMSSPPLYGKTQNKRREGWAVPYSLGQTSDPYSRSSYLLPLSKAECSKRLSRNTQPKPWVMP